LHGSIYQLTLHKILIKSILVNKWRMVTVTPSSPFVCPSHRKVVIAKRRNYQRSAVSTPFGIHWSRSGYSWICHRLDVFFLIRPIPCTTTRVTRTHFWHTDSTNTRPQQKGRPQVSNELEMLRYTSAVCYHLPPTLKLTFRTPPVRYSNLVKILLFWSF